MKYFPIPEPVEIPTNNGASKVLSFRAYLDLPGVPDQRGQQFTIWSHPLWRQSAENADAFIAARQAIAQAKKYCAMPDEAFEIFKPLALRAGDDLKPEFMPLVTPVLRATSTKPADFDEAQAAPAETVSAN